MAEKLITLARHGQAEHNLQTDRYMGRSPASNLTAQGRSQAARLGTRLHEEAHYQPAMVVQRIVSSSLPRCMQTAEIAGQSVAVEPEGEDAFWELSKGAWENSMRFADVPADAAEALAADPFGFRYPGGESYQDLVDRVVPAFEQWVAQMPEGRSLFVLHGDVIRAVLFHVLQVPRARIHDFQLDPCAITEFRLTEGRWVLTRLNDRAHLALYA